MLMVNNQSTMSLAIYLINEAEISLKKLDLILSTKVTAALFYVLYSCEQKHTFSPHILNKIQACVYNG